QAAAARFPLALDPRIAERRAGADPSIVGERLRDARLLRRVGDVERRVGHPERIEDPLLLKAEQRRAGDHLDHATSTSVAWLWSHVVPGWYMSGSFASRATNSSFVASAKRFASTYAFFTRPGPKNPYVSPDV